MKNSLDYNDIKGAQGYREEKKDPYTAMQAERALEKSLNGSDVGKGVSTVREIVQTATVMPSRRSKAKEYEKALEEFNKSEDVDYLSSVINEHNEEENASFERVIRTKYDNIGETLEDVANISNERMKLRDESRIDHFELKNNSIQDTLDHGRIRFIRADGTEGELNLKEKFKFSGTSSSNLEEYLQEFQASQKKLTRRIDDNYKAMQKYIASNANLSSVFNGKNSSEIKRMIDTYKLTGDGPIKDLMKAGMTDKQAISFASGVAQMKNLEESQIKFYKSEGGLKTQVMQLATSPLKDSDAYRGFNVIQQGHMIIKKTIQISKNIYQKAGTKALRQSRLKEKALKEKIETRINDGNPRLTQLRQAKYKAKYDNIVAKNARMAMQNSISAKKAMEKKAAQELANNVRTINRDITNSMKKASAKAAQKAALQKAAATRAGTAIRGTASIAGAGGAAAGSGAAAGGSAAAGGAAAGGSAAAGGTASAVGGSAAAVGAPVILIVIAIIIVVLIVFGFFIAIIALITGSGAIGGSGGAVGGSASGIATAYASFYNLGELTSSVADPEQTMCSALNDYEDDYTTNAALAALIGTIYVSSDSANPFAPFGDIESDYYGLKYWDDSQISQASTICTQYGITESYIDPNPVTAISQALDNLPEDDVSAILEAATDDSAELTEDDISDSVKEMLKNMIYSQSWYIYYQIENDYPSLYEQLTTFSDESSDGVESCVDIILNAGCFDTSHISGNARDAIIDKALDLYENELRPSTNNIILNPSGGTGGTESFDVAENAPLPDIHIPEKTVIIYADENYPNGTVLEYEIPLIFKGYYSRDDHTQYYDENGKGVTSWDNSVNTLYAEWDFPDDATITLPDLTGNYAEHIFRGWYTGEGANTTGGTRIDEDDWDNYNISEDEKLYAHWVRIVHPYN